MKKFLFSLLIIATGFAANAQTTTPRFGTTADKDNTYRNLTNGYTALTDAAGADSSTLVPKYYNSMYTITLVDSFTLKSPTVTNCFLGDRLTLLLTAASGTPKLKFTGSNWLGAGTATLSTNLRSVIQFIFDGAKWVETGRYTQ